MTTNGVLKHKAAVKMAAQLGCRVELVRRTGEVRVTSPDGQTRLVLNNRSKDAAHVLMLLLRRLGR